MTPARRVRRVLREAPRNPDQARNNLRRGRVPATDAAGGSAISTGWPSPKPRRMARRFRAYRQDSSAVTTTDQVPEPVTTAFFTVALPAGALHVTLTVLLPAGVAGGMVESVQSIANAPPALCTLSV
jgi:hypothetical protein